MTSSEDNTKRLGPDKAAFLSRTLMSRLDGLSNLDQFQPFEVTGTYLFCDVSGFTKLSEALMSMGREGSEELTRILNSYFKRMIRIIVAMGGDTLTFGGDAMAVLFPDDQDPAAATRRGVDAAWHMMDAMSEFASLKAGKGTVNLAMKIGIARGTALFGVLGNDDRGRHTYVAGEPLDGSADAEHHAEKGHIVLRQDVVQMLPDEYQLQPAGDGFSRLMDVPVAGAVPIFAAKPDGPDFAEVIVADYLREKLAADHRITSGEHRTAVILFIFFAGVDYTQPQSAHPALETLYGVLADTSHRYGGTINKVDMGDKGSKAIIVFGAPKAVEQAEEMACRCALDILAAPELKPLLNNLRIGISKGSIFAGFVGSSLRREYTVMGDAVNLSARLMAASEPFSSLANDLVYDQAAGVNFDVLEPIIVKGKSMAISIARPTGVKAGNNTLASPQEDFLGRQNTRDALKEFLAGEPGFCLLKGKAGSGKTLLVHSLLDGLQKETRYVPLASYQRHAFFSAFRPLFRQLMGINETMNPPQATQAVTDALLQDAEWAGLFRDVLGITLEKNAKIDTMPAKDRKEAFLGISRRFLQRVLQDQGGLLCFDQIENLDDASLEMLNSYRENPDGIGLPVLLCGRSSGLDDSPLETTLEMGPWVDEDLQAWLQGRFKWNPASQELVDLLLQRSGGNPLFVLELVKALEEAEVITGEKDLGWIFRPELLATAQLPEGLEALFLTQLDRLPEKLKGAAKTCAVAGTAFGLDLGSELFSERDDNPLHALQEQHILTIGQDIQFHNAMFRDAVYDSLNFSERRRLHSLVANALEYLAPDPQKIIGLLAHHFYESGDADRAIPILQGAAKEARSRHALTAAWQHLGRLESMQQEFRTAEDAALTTLEKAEVGRDLGFGSQVIEPLIAAQENLPVEEKAYSYFLLSEIFRFTGDIPKMLEVLTNGKEKIDQVAKNKKAFAFLELGIEQAMTGNMDEAHDQFSHSAKIAKDTNEPGFLLGAINNMANVAMFKGDFPKAQRGYGEGIATAEKLGLLRRAADMSHNIAALYDRQSNIPMARRYSKLAKAKFQISGFVNKYEISKANEGHYMSLIGFPDIAVKQLKSSLLYFTKTSQILEKTKVELKLGQCYLFLGDNEKARLAFFPLFYKEEFQTLDEEYQEYYLTLALQLLQASDTKEKTRMLSLVNQLQNYPGLQKLGNHYLEGVVATLDEWRAQIGNIGSEDAALPFWLAQTFLESHSDESSSEDLERMQKFFHSCKDRWLQANYWKLRTNPKIQVTLPLSTNETNRLYRHLRFTRFHGINKIIQSQFSSSFLDQKNLQI